MKKYTFEERIKRYEDNGQTDKFFLGGHTEKNFVRLDDDNDSFIRKKSSAHKMPKDSLFFKELFRELMSGKSSYKTYLNDLVEGKDSKDAYIPKYVSCLIKDLNDQQILYISETLGSRIANAIGVKTVYNIPHEAPRQEWQSPEDPAQYDYLISVDFIPSGYRVETLLDLGVYFNEDAPLSSIIKIIEKKLPAIAYMENIKLTEENIYRFKKDLIKQFLFRQFICEDNDFESKNIALLIGENGDFELAPCFDMEYIMYGKKSHYYYDSFAKQTIKFLRDTLPEVLEEFIVDCEKAYKSGKIKKIFEKTLPKAEQRDIEKMKMQTLDNFKTFIKLSHQPLSQVDQDDINALEDLEKV